MIGPHWMRLLPTSLALFLAGLLLGFSAGRRSFEETPQGLAPELQAYEAALISTLELRPQQIRELRGAMLQYQQERRRVIDQVRYELEPKFINLDRMMQGLLRDRLLDADQLARARELLKGRPLDGSMDSREGSAASLSGSEARR